MLGQLDLDFARSDWTQWVSLVLWGTAAFWGWRGATRGMVKHLVPRVVLTIGCTGLAISYAVDLIGGDNVFATALNMRRGFGWVVAVGVSWAAYTGIQAGKDIERQKTEEAKAAAEELIELIRQDRRDEEA